MCKAPVPEDKGVDVEARRAKSFRRLRHTARVRVQLPSTPVVSLVLVVVALSLHLLFATNSRSCPQVIRGTSLQADPVPPRARYPLLSFCQPTSYCPIQRPAFTSALNLIAVANFQRALLVSRRRRQKSAPDRLGQFDHLDTPKTSCLSLAPAASRA